MPPLGATHAARYMQIDQHREAPMAKGQQRTTKEKKKPKAEKKAGGQSAYAQQYKAKGGSAPAKG
jgi:hypothetical protein